MKKNISSDISALKIHNLRSIFCSIQKNGSTTRRRIQEETGLSWGTVSQFSNLLLSAGIAVEGSIQNGSIGKAPTELELNPQDYFLVGIDLTLSHTCGILINLRGEEICSRSIAIEDPEHVIQDMCSMVQEFSSGSKQEKRILAIGVSVAGSVDLQNGVLLHSIFSEKWENLEIRRMLETRLQLPVFVYHDSECVLEAEKRMGIIEGSACKNIALVTLQYGVGMAFTHDSRHYYSSGMHQCELGHITVYPGGTLCNCGKRGCLEMYASRLGIPRQFLEAVRQGAVTDVNPYIFDASLYDTIRDHALRGDPLCLRLFEQLGKLLGSACASMCTLLEPDVLILYGGLLEDGTLWKEIFETYFRENIFPMCQTKIRYSTLTAAAPMLGAAFCALDMCLDDFLAEVLYDNGHTRT